MEENQEDDKVRFLFFKGWKGIYALLMIVLATCIGIFYWITLSFA